MAKANSIASVKYGLVQLVQVNMPDHESAISDGLRSFPLGPGVIVVSNICFISQALLPCQISRNK
jgi:hypothetical protein